MSEESALSFRVSSVDEPHMRRHYEILRVHPEIKGLFGYDSRTAIVTFIVVIVQLALAWSFQHLHDLNSPLGSFWILIPFSYFVGAILSHWLAMSVHEATHNLALPTPEENRWLSLLANIPFLFPASMTFRRYHLDHHALLGVERLDSDLPVPLEVQMIGRSRIRKFFWLLGYFLVYALRGSTFMRRPNRWEWFNLGLQTVVVAAIAASWGWVALLYLGLSTLFGHSLHPVAAHFIHEHYIFSGTQETYSYYGPLNRVTFNVGYHYEHHDFMNVPGRLLPKLHSIAPEYYTLLKSHTSWTGVLWRFVMDSEMGPFKRIVRTYTTHLRQRRRLKREAWVGRSIEALGTVPDVAQEIENEKRQSDSTLMKAIA